MYENYVFGIDSNGLVALLARYLTADGTMLPANA